MIFKHENMKLDLTTASKGKLYKDGKLIFIGDGYRAITTMVSQSQDPEPVKYKFNAQLTMREKTKFSKAADIETLRKQAMASFSQQELVKHSKKK